MIYQATLIACVAALQRREQSCERQGISALVWTRAKHAIQAEMVRREIDGVNPELPALLRRQAE